MGFSLSVAEHDGFVSIPVEQGHAGEWSHGAGNCVSMEVGGLGTCDTTTPPNPQSPLGKKVEAVQGKSREAIRGLKGGRSAGCPSTGRLGVVRAREPWELQVGSGVEGWGVHDPEHSRRADEVRSGDCMPGTHHGRGILGASKVSLLSSCPG